ncbi:hypothetical protein E3N88_43359 [Mikania micrantha]|uniref:Uncharacterized protein n=1 Tax=Mikania micrantha TaxID=192012 RepID=A0A5N6LF54_9ASTR|nr:hypothetical protein E3N88_43359 [Mikania micrantha]
MMPVGQPLHMLFILVQTSFHGSPLDKNRFPAHLRKQNTRLVWTKNLLQELGLTTNQPPTLFCDNTGATYLCANPVYHSRMKHIALDYHFVREQVSAGKLRVLHISSQDQLADMLTKPLARSQSLRNRSKIRVSDGSSILKEKMIKTLHTLPLLNTVPLSLGVDAHDGIFSAIIPRNTPIPVANERIYFTTIDNQTSIHFNAYQGERSIAKENKWLGEFEVVVLPAPKELADVDEYKKVQNQLQKLCVSVIAQLLRNVHRLCHRRRRFGHRSSSSSERSRRFRRRSQAQKVNQLRFGLVVGRKPSVLSSSSSRGTVGRRRSSSSSSSKLRIPKVQQLLQEFFIQEKLLKGINVNEAGAHGAAIHAANLIHKKRENDKDITYLTGERSIAKENKWLGEFEVVVSPAPKGKSKVKVVFSVDDDDEVIKMMVNDAEKFKLEDQEYIKIMCARNVLEEYIYNVNKKMKTIGITDMTRLHAEEIKKMVTAIDKYKKVQDQLEKRCVGVIAQLV